MQDKKQSKKKLTKAIAITCLIGLLFPVFAQAWSITDKAFGMMASAMLYAVNWLLQQVFTVVAKLTAAAGLLLDWSIRYSIMENSHRLFKSGFVLNGWEICRDLANLGFIFVLLFIGIATIIQLQTYAYRKLLVGVLIAALLVNFSMSITLVIIDAGNIVGMEFLCAMTNDRCEAEAISATLAEGFNFHTLLGDPKRSDLVNEGGGEPPALTDERTALVYLLGIGLLLVVAFVLTAGALMFLMRTLVLMFLIIFAPIAFVAAALKSGLAKKWWHALFNQTFFAPIYLFFLYLVVDFINAPAGLSAVTNLATPGVANNKSFFDFITSGETTSADIIVQFILMTAMLIASLVASKQMGAWGASGAINMGNRMRKSATGYAGRITKKAGVRGGGLYAKAFAEGPGGEIMKSVARIPLIGKTTRPITTSLARLERAREQDIDKKTKQYVSYSPAAMASIAPTLGAAMQKSFASQLSDEKMEKMLANMPNDEDRVAFGRKVNKQDRKAGEKVAKATRSLELGTRITSDQPTPTQVDIDKYLDSLTTEDYKKLNYKNLEQNPKILERFLAKTHSKDLQQALKTRKNIEDFSSSVKNLLISQNKPATADMLADEIEHLNKNINNPELAKYFRGAAGTKVIMQPKEIVIKKGGEEKKA